MEKNVVCLPGMTQILDDKIWISLLEVNGLVKVDIKTGEAKFIEKFPDTQQEYMLHYHIVTYHDKIIFFPWNTSEITIYDLNKQKFRSVLLNKVGRIYTSILRNEIFYLISDKEQEIIEFDAIHEKVIDSYKPQVTCENSPFSINVTPFLYQENIWNIGPHALWKFDIKNKTFTSITDFLQKDIICVCESKGDLWIVTADLKVYQRTKDENKEYCYDLQDCVSNESIGVEKWTAESVFLNNKLLIAFQDINMMLQIPKSDKGLNIERAQCVYYETPFFSIQQNVMVIFEKNRITIINDDGERSFSLQNSFDVLNEIMRKSTNAVFMETNNYTMQLENYIHQIVCGINR